MRYIPIRKNPDKRNKTIESAINAVVKILGTGCAGSEYSLMWYTIETPKRR